MIVLRLIDWAFRRKTLPIGHYPGCRGGLPALPGEPFEIVMIGPEPVHVVVCRCGGYKPGALRPPTLYEAVFGISNT